MRFSPSCFPWCVPHSLLFLPLFLESPLICVEMITSPKPPPFASHLPPLPSLVRSHPFCMDTKLCFIQVFFLPAARTYSVTSSPALPMRELSSPPSRSAESIQSFLSLQLSLFLPLFCFPPIILFSLFSPPCAYLPKPPRKRLLTTRLRLLKVPFFFTCFFFSPWSNFTHVPPGKGMLSSYGHFPCLRSLKFLPDLAAWHFFSYNFPGYFPHVLPNPFPAHIFYVFPSLRFPVSLN